MTLTLSLTVEEHSEVRRRLAQINDILKIHDLRLRESDISPGLMLELVRGPKNEVYWCKVFWTGEEAIQYLERARIRVERNLGIYRTEGVV